MGDVAKTVQDAASEFASAPAPGASFMRADSAASKSFASSMAVPTGNFEARRAASADLPQTADPHGGLRAKVGALTGASAMFAKGARKMLMIARAGASEFDPTGFGDPDGQLSPDDPVGQISESVGSLNRFVGRFSGLKRVGSDAKSKPSRASGPKRAGGIRTSTAGSPPAKVEGDRAAASIFDRASGRSNGIASDTRSGLVRSMLLRWRARSDRRRDSAAVAFASARELPVTARPLRRKLLSPTRPIVPRWLVAAFGSGPILLVGTGFLILTLLSAVVAVFGAHAESEGGGLTGNEKTIYSYLHKKELDDVLAAAIMGNMSQESGMNPAAKNPKSGAYGICQWLGGRLRALEDRCRRAGKPVSDLEMQLDHFWSEFSMDSPGGWSTASQREGFLSSAGDLDSAVEMFARYFERCGKGEMNLAHRIAEASRILAAIHGQGGGIASIGDLQWPSATMKWGTYPHHWGLDIQASYGSPIFASADGLVINASSKGTWGNYVRIYHPALKLQTGYAHMSRFAVAVGQTVKKGQVIGYVGATGHATGPHLHYEIYETGSPAMSYTPIFDDMDKWGKYFDRAELDGNRVW